MRKNKNKILTNKIINELFFILVISLIFSANLYAQNVAVINLDSTHQVIRGFGAANILQWRPDMTASEIETAFGTEDGQLGFTILRLMIEADSDRWNLYVSTAKKAYDMGVTIIASPWYAPEEMVETVSGVSRVRYDMYDEYAAHLDSFNTYMTNNDVPMYAISVQNEPDWNGGWTQWTADEMLTFMSENASAIGTRVMAPESFQFRRAMSDPILNDAVACANLDIVGGHIYGGGLAPYPLAESKEKEVWMTEYLINSGSPPANLDIDIGWTGALQTAQSINDCMNANMSAYVWWYIVRYYGPIADGSYATKGDVTKKGYVMSQFARFIRPGYLRVQCDDNPQSDVFASAYRDSTSSTVVIVAINTSSQTKNQTFVFQNGDVERLRPFVTSETKNCSRGSSISVINDSLDVTLDGESITTFVSGDIATVKVENPVSFKLSQNYPNPFNQSTQINFEIPEKSFVSLKVHNLLGQEIEELAGKEYSAGGHSVIFDASHLASGIYFFTLRARDFTETRKMSIMR
jgi:glucuronoarabinoxylan endo-1,4-beta-xylanase